MSLTSVLFPLPLTPVTTTKQPSGSSTSMSRRLCSRAPRIVIHFEPGCRRSAGTGIVRCVREVLAGDRLGLGEQVVDACPTR